MNSIAIWWDKKDALAETNPSIHLDINLWRSNNTDSDAIELGIKVKDYLSVNKLFIDLPFYNEAAKCEDLVPGIVKDNNLIRALFNDAILVSPNDGFITEATFSNGDKIFFCSIDVLKKDQKFILSGGDKRTRITIELSSFHGKNSNSNPIYFRFRLNCATSIYQTTNENYIWFDSIFRKIAIMDINLNVIRKLPPDIASKVSNASFTSINMFLMTDSIISFDFVSIPVSKSRILEKDVWDEYKKGTKIDSKQIVAYHWKQKEEAREYSLFSKFSFSRKRWWLPAIFVLITVCIGAVGGVLGNYITTKYFDSFATGQSKKLEDNKS